MVRWEKIQKKHPPTPIQAHRLLLRSSAFTCVIWGRVTPCPSSGEGERTFQGGIQEKPATGSKRPLRGSLCGHQGVLQPLCKVGWEQASGSEGSWSSQGVGSTPVLQLASFGKLLNLSLTLLAYKTGAMIIAPASQGGSENLMS